MARAILPEGFRQRRLLPLIITLPHSDRRRLSPDREALARALVLDPHRDPSDDPPPDRKREPERWYEAAHSASYALQCAALRPKPWQPVPANDYVSVTDDDSENGPVMGRAAAAELLRRLLAAGLSRYEPDPVNALARVEAERARHAIDQPSIERGMT